MKTRYFLSLIFSLFLAGQVNAQFIAGGGSHSMAVCTDSTMRAWGFNSAGELGNGSGFPSNVPVQVNNMSGVKAIAGGLHSMAAKNDGTVWCWGQGSDGQLGNGSNTSSNVPVQVPGLNDITAVAAGFWHSLALRSNGTIRAWGKNTFGQLGNADNMPSNVPVVVLGINNVVSIAARGGSHSMALKSDGTVWCWGNNSNGELGTGNNIPSDIPVQVNGLTGAIYITSGGTFSAAIKNDGTVWCWGNNTDGQLGNGTNTSSNIPVQVTGLTDVIAIAGGSNHMIALKSDSTVWSWGNGTLGQLGNLANSSSNVPVNIFALPVSVVGIASGDAHSLALLNDGSVYAWGAGGGGQLGDGTFNSSNAPVLVSTLCNTLTSITEKDNELSVGLYPNPNSGQFTIEASEGNIAIYNSMGAVMYEDFHTGGNVEYSVGDLSPGIYFVRISNESGSATQKFLVDND